MPDIAVPYITRWTSEHLQFSSVTRHPSGCGIAYWNETIGDRDKHGVLWSRINSAPGIGRPEFGKIHPLRQRRAMLRLLCQVCGEPADRGPDGVLWLLPDHRDGWVNWPEAMFATEPPICRPCADLSTRQCPALRYGHVLIRSRHHEIAGVKGMRFHPGTVSVVVTPADMTLIAYADPLACWVLAHDLARELHDCTILD